MRLNIVSSKNAKSYYVIKDYVKDNGKRSTKIVEKLGTHQEILEKCGDLDPVAWARAYIAELNRLEKAGQFEHLVKFSSNKRLVKDKDRFYKGGYLFLQAIYYQLGLDLICQQISIKYKFEYDLNAILCMLVVTRIIEPGSKASSLATAQSFLEKPQYILKNIYRSLQVLYQNSDFIQAELYKNSKRLVQRNDRILYYDCTNYYFETEYEDDFRRFGKGKENRPNPIVQMGLFMDADGLPLAFSVFNGNANEQPSLKPLEEKILRDFGLAKFIVCTDAGLSSHANRLFNTQGQRSFVTTQSLKNLKEHLRLWALDPAGWSLGDDGKIYNLEEIDEKDDRQHDRVYHKSRWINEDGLEQQMIVTFSPVYKSYSSRIREEQINRAFKKLENPGSLKKARPNDPKRFIKKYSVTEDGEVAAKDLFYLDEAAIAEEKKYDGFYAVCTNLEAEPRQIIEINKGRWQIEAAFRVMKSEFKARPVYLRHVERIQAHFLSCFIALLVYRILQRKITDLLPDSELSGEKIIRQLREINFIYQEGDGYIPVYKRTAITDALHEEFGFSTDLELVPGKQMQKIVKMTKGKK